MLLQGDAITAPGDARAAPAVSVIVCVYDGDDYVGAAIESALAQTYGDFELIAVDDGSTDGSSARIAAIEDPRIRLVRQANAGAAGALATGIREARGRYVAVLDQDDLWLPENLARHVEWLESNPTVDLTFSWYRVIDSAGRPIGLRSQRHRGSIGFRDLLRDFVIGATSNVVMRREAIERAGGIDASIARLYDLDLFLRVALLAPGNCVAVPEELMLYRRHSAQMSRCWEPLREEWWRVLDKLRRLAPAEVAAEEGRARANMGRYFARIAYESARYGAGLRLLREAFSASRLHFAADLRNWSTAAACVCGLALPPRMLRTIERAAGLRRAL